MQVSDRIRPLVCTVLAFFLLIPALFALAAPADTGKRVVVGYYAEPGMMDGAEEGADKSGYAYEYLQALASQAGWEYDYVYGSYSELYAKLLSGEIDMLPYVIHTDTHAEEVCLPDAAMGEEQFYIASLKIGQLSDDLHELEGARVGATRDDFPLRVFEDLMQEKGITYQLTLYDTHEELEQALAQGVLDYTLERSTVYQEVDLHAVYTFPGRCPYYLAAAPGRADLLAGLNAAQQQLTEVNPNFLDTLNAKYFRNIPLFKELPDESWAWLASHETIRVGTYSNDVPYTIENEDGTVTGVLPDYLALMLASVGVDCPVEWHSYRGRQEAVQALKAGEIDCINPYYHNYNDAEQLGLILSSAVYNADFSVLYEGAYTAETMSVIATPVTRLGTSYVRDNYPDTTVLPCLDGNDCIDRLLSGEATCVVMHTNVLESIAKGYDKIFHIKSLNAKCPVCFAALPKDAPLISILNKSIPFVTDLELNAIQNKYNAEDQTRMTFSLSEYAKLHPERIFFTLTVILAALLALLLYRRNKDKAYARRLEEAKEQAEASSRAKSAFLSSMSHDIRTPMNAILGYAAMARKHTDDPQLSGYLNNIDVSGQQLLGLINQVLEMSRIESGRIELEEQPADVVEQAHVIETILSAEAIQKNLTLTIELGEIAHRYVRTDISRVNQLVTNITGNAIKYTPEGGTIHYKLEEKPWDTPGYGLYVITVSDTGIGMSKDYLSKIFEEFSRENTSTVSHIQGSGLGMSIVKRLADLMGGTVEVCSEQGQGTAVSVALPMKWDDAPPAPLPLSPEPKTFPSLAGVRVLLVEDNEMNREIATDILTECGMTVTAAEDGQIAVSLVQEKGAAAFDCILMDIQMPIMNGHEAARAIRQLPDGGQIPIIALSANAFAEDRKNSLAAGMNAHIAKPIDVKVLYETLAGLTG